jgi:hypothetical protein
VRSHTIKGATSQQRDSTEAPYFTKKNDEIPYQAKKETFPEPTSEKIRSRFSMLDFNNSQRRRKRASNGCVIAWFEYTKYRITTANCSNRCLPKSGYFGYSSWAIYYLPQSGKSSLDLMGGRMKTRLKKKASQQQELYVQIRDAIADQIIQHGFKQNGI